MNAIRKFFVATFLIAVVSISSIANAALVERLGGLAYYDDVADLTWLTDANAAGTTMNWADANAWAAGLVVGGDDNWRLADTSQPDTNCDSQSSVSYGYNCTGSEMGNLFYNVLGNSAGSLSNTGPFSNVQSNVYWLAGDYAPIIGNAWVFNMNNGFQGSASKTVGRYAWAVQSGDVSAVPVPAAVWLFGSGLLGLIGIAKRKKSA